MSDNFSFDQIICPICQKPVSKGGAAFTSHSRMHVRNGEAIEYKRNGKLVFLSKDNLIEQEPYAKLGDEPLPGQPAGVWYIPELSKELPKIDPTSYFVTSGEAVKKAEKLVKDAYSLAVRSKAFYKKLIKARGEKKYLETSHENGRLLCKQKSPRNQI